LVFDSSEEDGSFVREEETAWCLSYQLLSTLGGERLAYKVFVTSEENGV
jgi:hypothetical protein